MEGPIYQFRIGDRVKNPATVQQGTVRDRQHVLVQHKQGLDKDNQYEIVCDDGRCFREFESNLKALEMLTRETD
jgi:hypothetical protein